MYPDQLIMLLIFQEEPSKAEAVAKHFSLNNVEVNLSEEDEQGMTYLKFNKLIRPLIVEANPGTAHTKVNSLLGAIWSDYKRKKGMNLHSSSTASPKGGSKAKKQKTTRKSTKPAKQAVSIEYLSECTALSVLSLLYLNFEGFYLSVRQKSMVGTVDMQFGLKQKCYNKASVRQVV